MAVPHFIAFEVLDVVDRPCRMLATGWVRSLVSVVGMEMIIDVAVKALRAVKPRAYANENASGKPLGAVIAVWSTVVGRHVVVTVGTFRSGPDFDRDLGLGFGSVYGETDGSHSRQQQQH
jgi:hypothetical protein